MMGSATSQLLLAQGHHVTVANRLRWDWDTAHTIAPFVRQLYCDRHHMEDSCTRLRASGNYDAVVDFSTYISAQMTSMLSIIAAKAPLYIYISTDSVYEVCPPSEHGGPSKETDALGPKQAKEVADSDDYGREKLLAEHVLEQHFKEHTNTRFIILRLPDVIGPRDRTRRWWSYQLWLAVHQKLKVPVHIPPFLTEKKLSFVYSGDVATVIAQFINGDHQTVVNEAFNLAWPQTVTLRQLLSQIAECINVTEVNFTSGQLHFYPSVTRGVIDVQKAVDMLKWGPTPMTKAICQLCTFYDQAAIDFPNELTKVIEDLSPHFASNNADVEVLRRMKTHTLKRTHKRMNCEQYWDGLKMHAIQQSVSAFEAPSWFEIINACSVGLHSSRPPGLCASSEWGRCNTVSSIDCLSLASSVSKAWALPSVNTCVCVFIASSNCMDIHRTLHFTNLILILHFNVL